MILDPNYGTGWYVCSKEGNPFYGKVIYISKRTKGHCSSPPGRLTFSLRYLQTDYRKLTKEEVLIYRMSR
jgi:hypothetical protein